MPIEGVCPTCGARFDLAAALTDGEARQALAAALSLPAPLARLVVPYLSLHAPGKKRIAWRKLARLLRELTALVEAGRIVHGGQSYAAPLELWREGLEKVLAAADAGQLTLPLEGHGYLTKVVFTCAKRKASRQAAAGKPIHPSHVLKTEDRGQKTDPSSDIRPRSSVIAEHLEQMRRSVGKP